VLSRAGLPKTAKFTFTQTVAPTGGAKTSTVMRVEVKNNKARVEYANPAVGAVTLLSNEKGFFVYVPANKIAQKQNFQGGVDRALQVMFQQVNDLLRGAQKTGTATVSGQPTDVYKNGKKGATIYISKNPNFRLPIKAVVTNAGGTRTLLVSNIKTNIALADARFAVPAGTQIIASNGSAAGSVPGFGR
jgi:outer membrane lipoprotein-sorting protein